MKSWELEQMIREEGREEGEQRYTELIQYLLRADRYDDLKKSAEDLEYRKLLYRELPGREGLISESASEY